MPECDKEGNGVIVVNTGKEIDTGVFGFLCAECKTYGFMAF